MTPSENLTNLLIKAVNRKIQNNPDSSFLLAISGGSSPLSLFKLWTGKYLKSILWKNIDLFWVDERCVPPENPESNYGVAKKMLLDIVPIPENRIHRIMGEENPCKEAERYEEMVRKHLKGVAGFDMVILGIGEDGHTSSIFPGQEYLLSSSKLYEESINPHSGQKRISLTGNGILNASNPVFFISGQGKAQALLRISDVSYLSRERVKSTFYEDFRTLIAENVPEDRYVFEWHDTQHDPEGFYKVDCHINNMATPLCIYALPNDNQVRDATISLFQFEKWENSFYPIAIFQDADKVSKKVLKKFSKVCDKQFPSLQENRLEIANYLREVLSL